MKTGVLMNIYNEIEWIDLAIQAVKDEFDEIVIVEGAYQIAIQSGANPRSNDGTLEVLNKYRDQKNITIIHANEQDHCFQNNKALEVLKAKGVEWVLLVDGDEIWEKNNLKIIKNYMVSGEAKGIYQYWVYFYNFVNDFDQFIEARMRRVYKITPGCSFLNGNENLQWPDHGKSVDTGQPVSYVSEIPQFCRGFHYTEIKTKNRWLLKKNYLQKRDNNPRFKSWHVTEDGVQHDEMHMIKPFTKKHPKSVQEHELYKLWGQDRAAFKKKLFG
jgi:glycosyltransferase involved in cell wall biosynthesis